MKIKDQLQRELYFEKPPQRIVSLVPSQSELLVDLGLEDKIFGVTKFCVHPAHLRKSKKIVGGTKKVHYEKIRELNPDVILCNKEENTKEMVLELEKIAPVHVSDVINIADSLALIEQYGALFKKEDEASGIIKGIGEELENFSSSKFPPRKVAYLIWRKPWMAVGSNTFINSLLKLNGWENVFENQISRYPETDLEDIQRLNPEIILLSSEPFPFQDKHIKEILNSYNGSRVELVDGEYFSWYGSRLLPAIKYFQHLQIKLSNSL